jgi:CBS-domain-containing membrane protein|tara:strand:+ start:47779 stop:48309 length:531 start_codon:yes stop_codon:yes gene_type:complete
VKNKNNKKEDIMPCRNALITDVVSCHPDDTVEKVMAIMEEKRIRHVPVIDENNVLMGMFGYSHLLNELLPVSVKMEDGLQRLNFVIGASPGVAKRLRKVYKNAVKDHLFKDVCVVSPDTPTWEATRLIVKYGSPLPVLEENTGKFVGLISEQSLFAELLDVLDEVEKDEAAEGSDA